MNFWTIVGTVRKLWHFVVGLFPILLTFSNAFDAGLRSLLERGALAPHWSRLNQSKQFKAIKKINERFIWRDYSSDQLNLERLPSDVLPILRQVFIFSVALCLLIPFATAGREMIAITTFSGFKGTAPNWSVWLWMATAALAWGCAVAGTAWSNRVAFIISAFAYVMIFGTCAFYIPRSYWNALVPASAVIMAALCERQLREECRSSTIFGIINCILVCAFAGVYTFAATPLHSFSGPNAVLYGTVLGCSLGPVCFLWSRLKANLSAPFALRGQPVSLVTASLIISSACLGFMVSLVWRSSPSAFGGQLVSMLTLWNSYLWPVWYFLGVGIIFKLLKSAKIFADSVADTIPPKLYAPSVLIAIAASAALTWSEYFVLHVNAYGGLWSTISQPFFSIYSLSASWLWSNQILCQSSLVMRWILLVDLLFIAFLGVRKRLSAKVISTIFFLTMLGWFLVSEYMFQLLSFQRSPGHSVLTLVLFSIWLLWLFHKVGLDMSLRSSPLWPAVGRLPVYGSILLFLLLEINARCALQDFNVTNEFYMALFRGVIDVGLPYGLYIYATRRFKTLPLGLKGIFISFCLGGMATLPINVLDKLALCNWSIEQFRLLWATQSSLLLEKGISSLPAFTTLPVAWVAVRSLLFVVSLYLVAQALKRKADIENGSGLGMTPPSILFCLVSFASGFASFYKTFVDLPLPIDMRALLAPVYSTVFFDTASLATFLTAWTISMLIGLECFRRTKATRRFATSVFCFLICFSASYMWPAMEPWLYSSGTIITLAVLLVGLFLYLCRTCLERINDCLQKTDEEKTESADPKQFALVSRSEINILAAGGLVLCLVTGAIQITASRMIPQQIPSLGHCLNVPASWGNQLVSDQKSSSFKLVNLPGASVTATITTKPSVNGGSVALLKQLSEDARSGGTLRNLSLIKLEYWNHYSAGCCALSYTFDQLQNGATIPVMGITAAKPGTGGNSEIYTILGTPSEVLDRKWDLVRVIGQSF